VFTTEILYQPAYAMARLTIDNGTEVRAEAGAMVSMGDTIEIQTKAQGGFLKSLSRSVLGGESFFMNTFRAKADGSELNLAPNLPGDIIVLPLNNEEWIVQSGSYLASDINISVDTKWGGAKTFFGGEGLFMLRCAGTGQLIVASYGAIHKVTIPAGRTYMVDTGHVVAFPAHTPYQIQKVGSWKSSIFGGEGLALTFQGPADIFMQSRSPEAFLSWLIPNIPSRNS
jgi:uncharacterized protein (TIGR00266 family)